MFSLRNTTQELNDSTDYVEFKRGIKTSIPMLLGIIPFALVLGTQATQKGFSHLEVPLFTGLNFAGGSEFAVLEVWTNPPNFLVLIFITFLVNSRHLLMGASLVPYLRHLLQVCPVSHPKYGRHGQRRFQNMDHKDLYHPLPRSYLMRIDHLCCRQCE